MRPYWLIIANQEQSCQTMTHCECWELLSNLFYRKNVLYIWVSKLGFYKIGNLKMNSVHTHVWTLATRGFKSPRMHWIRFISVMYHLFFYKHGRYFGLRIGNEVMTLDKCWKYYFEILEILEVKYQKTVIPSDWSLNF